MTNLQLAILNALLYLTLFLVHYLRSKRITVGIFLAFVYTAIACFCIVSVNNEPSKWSLTLWPFIYLFICVYFFLRPMLVNTKLNIRFESSDYPIYKKIAQIYICMSLFSCLVYLPVAYEHILNPQWADLYTESHEVKETNFFIKISNLFFHIRYLGLILFFYFLTYGAKIKFHVLMGISAILPVLLVTICNASRGGLIALAVSVILTYFMFSSYLSKKIKRFLKTMLLLILPVGVIYVVAVTLARFDPSISYVSAEDSVTYYLGHSMLMFNYGLVDTINRYWYGNYMFGLGELPYNGTHYGTDFFTIVGAFYQDFGPILSFILILFISKYFDKIFKKKQIGIPEFFLILTYSMLVFNGVFVVGVGYGIQFIEAFLIYYILKKYQKKKTYVRSNSILSSTVSSNNP